MATASIALPPMGKISLITTWTGTVFYGINCVVYGLCMFVLLRERRFASGRWVLVLSSTVLFFLCTAYAAASLQQLLDAFVYEVQGVPDYATIYFLTPTNPMRTPKDILFVCLTLVQDVILIWRLYVVFNRDWKIVILPAIVDAASMAVAFADSVLYATPNSDAGTLVNLSVVSWSLDLILNVSVTLAIAARLWSMGRVVSSLRASQPTNNAYASAVYVVIESGAIFAGMTIVLLVLYVTLSNTDSPIDLALMDIASQLAALTPLLIVVRVGLGLTHGLPHTSENIVMSGQSGTQSGTTTRVQQSLKDMRFRAGSSQQTDVEHEIELFRLPNQSLDHISGDMKV